MTATLFSSNMFLSSSLMERFRSQVETRSPQTGNRLPLLKRTRASFPGPDPAQRRLDDAWNQRIVRSPTAYCALHEQRASVMGTAHPCPTSYSFVSRVASYFPRNQN